MKKGALCVVRFRKGDHKKSIQVECPKSDNLVKSRHSRVGGNPESPKLSKKLDSRFHGNDGEAHFQTFYEVIKSIPF
jgi:hypothetical protein